MNRLRQKLAVNGVASILTVIFILSMTAVPVLAKAVGSITGDHIMDGTISNVDIADDAAIDASKINRAGLDADTLDGNHSNDFAPSAHEHDISSTHDHDSDYLGVNGPQSINDTLTVSALSYDATKTGYYSLGREAFKEARYSGHDSITVHLPQGAVITELQAGLESLSYSSAYIRLNRIHMPTDLGWSSPEEVAFVSHVGPAEFVKDTSIISPRVDNSVYAYHLQATVPSLGFIYSARITYTYTTPVN